MSKKAERKLALKELMDVLNSDRNPSSQVIDARKKVISMLAGEGLFIIERNSKVEVV